MVHRFGRGIWGMFLLDISKIKTQNGIVCLTVKAFSHKAKQCVHIMPHASTPGLILKNGLIIMCLVCVMTCVALKICFCTTVILHRINMIYLVHWIE